MVDQQNGVLFSYKKEWSTDSWNNMEEPQRYHLGTFLVVQWIKLCLLLKGLQVQFLVKELRPRVPLSQKKKQNITQKQYCNKFINTFLKVVCCLIAGPYLTLLRPHGLYVARQAPLSTGFPRQESWSGLPFSSPGDLPNTGIEPTSPALVGGFFITEPPGKPF